MPTSKRLSYLLIASLALNLFLGGLYAGQWLEGWRHGPEPARGAALRFRFDAFVESLPEAAQGQARQVVERHRPELRTAFQGAHQARREARAALEAEPFEPARLEAALTAIRENSGAAHLAMHQAMAELAAGLTPEARRSLANGLARPRHRRGPPPQR